MRDARSDPLRLNVYRGTAPNGWIFEGIMNQDGVFTTIYPVIGK
jgi:hypothetical protein